MKSISIPSSYLALALSLCSASAFAGGVSDGGGGTTNPRPATAERVARSASRQAGITLLVWLQSEEKNFRRGSDEYQATDSERFLFAQDRDIFAVLRDTGVELRMGAPCLDANGKPWDGSIYSSLPHSVCISPFTMGPKLSELNYEAETVALILHEFSHLLGASEEEADDIQNRAVLALSKVDFGEAGVDVDSITGREGTDEGSLPWFLNGMDWIAKPYPIAAFNNFAEGYFSIKTQLQLTQFRSQALRQDSMDLFDANFARIEMIRDGSCAQFGSDTADALAWCKDRIQRAFRDAVELDANQIRSNLNDAPITNPQGENVRIGRTDTPEGLRAEAAKLRAYFEGVLRELREVRGFHFITSRTK